MQDNNEKKEDKNKKDDKNKKEKDAKEKEKEETPAAPDLSSQQGENIEGYNLSPEPGYSNSVLDGPFNGSSVNIYKYIII